MLGNKANEITKIYWRISNMTRQIRYLTALIMKEISFLASDNHLSLTM